VSGAVFPENRRREIVFCGRSNVGKSSLLNALTGMKGLARTSKTPGRTREIHFYEQGEDRYLVDLPGYGYAKVPQSERRAWAGLVEGYLVRTHRIALAVLLVDSRHPPFETDLNLADALSARGVPYVVALTKADKAGLSERTRAQRAAAAAFPGAAEHLLTSSATGHGIRELSRMIDRAVAGPRP
jgi:GTP-binding protein